MKKFFYELKEMFNFKNLFKCIKDEFKDFHDELMKELVKYLYK